MNNESTIRVRRARWPDEAGTLKSIRAVVFVDEQKVPPELEWDGSDDDCIHAIALLDDQPVGTGRLTTDGKIGRMAVLRDYRGRGIGAAIVRHLLQEAKGADLSCVKLGAQTHAIGFYADLGFTAYGDEFLDADMPHRMMQIEFNQD